MSRAHLFDGIYGRFYDAGIRNRALAPWGGFLMWGADIVRLYRLMEDSIACEEGEVVLDVPTGGGVTFATGAPRTRGLLVGADISMGMLRRAAPRRPAHVELVQADAGRLPLGDASVDRACCFNSLHCLPRGIHGKVLKELRRVLKPGGALVGTVLVTDAEGPWRLNVQLARLSGFFSPADSRTLARQARRAGFRHWEADLDGALLTFRAE